MGNIVSTIADGAGTVFGTVISAPIKTIFGESCENVCVGTWDIFCFIENFCISSLVKVVMISLLIYIILLFFYLLYQVGIIQCIGRSCCRMSWAFCETYWCAIAHVSCFLCHKIRNVKRVHRRRRDLEAAYSFSDEDTEEGSPNHYESLRVAVSRKRSVRERRKQRMRSSLRPRRQLTRNSSKDSNRHSRRKTKVSHHYERSHRRH